MYHYTEIGLDNVWLENGYIERSTPYGKAVAVIDADELHRVVALRIVEKMGRVTGKELRFLRTMLDLSQAGLSKLLGVTEQAVSLWERTGKVPKSSDTVVRVLVLAKLDGHKAVGDLLAQITTVERIVHQRIVARETTRKKWTTRVTVEAEAEAEAA
jgi:DNA-binding transcriptional regulator YiaG